MKTGASIFQWLRYSALVFLATTAINIGAVRAGVMIAIPGDPITIDSGKVAGTLIDSGVRAYWGIPFAAPPVGELRWHAPMPVKPWKGVSNADTPRPGCVQRIMSSMVLHAPPDTEPVGEDCLNLNVWAPSNAKAGAKLPVIVYIHGGGFQGGSPNNPEYSTAEIAKKGIVCVNIGYRVNVFGYLAHPELTKESGHNASGNWGMLDQIAGLQWIQRNIASFGGDPANVTIVGESAGSESVHLLQASPLARGLFAKVSGWSGAVLPPGNRTPLTLKEAEANGLKLQEALHVNSLAEMRALGWDSIYAAADRTFPRSAGSWRPIVDGYALPDLPVNIFKAGKQNDVPVYASSTAKDLGSSQLFFEVKTLAEYQNLAKETFGDAMDEFLKLFPASNDAEAVKQAQAVVAGNGFGITNRDWARAQALTGQQPSYLAQFARVQPFTPGVKWINFDPATAGAAHASDIQYWLGTYRVRSNQVTWTAWDTELSEKMRDTLIAFAKTGNPSTSAVKVPRYDPSDEQRIVFGDKIWVEKLSTAQLEFLRAHPTPNPPRSPTSQLWR